MTFQGQRCKRIQPSLLIRCWIQVHKQVKASKLSCLIGWAEHRHSKIPILFPPPVEARWVCSQMRAMFCFLSRMEPPFTETQCKGNCVQRCSMSNMKPHWTLCNTNNGLIGDLKVFSKFDYYNYNIIITIVIISINSSIITNVFYLYYCYSDNYLVIITFNYVNNVTV